MRHLFCIYTLFILVFFSTTVKGQAPEVPRTHTFPGIENSAFPYAKPEEVGMSTENLEKLGNEITSWVANGELVGAELLIIKDGKSVFHEAYGWSDRERRIPVERNSIWSIKSMSKPFTATAVLMLAEEGRLSLDDPVSRYIPGFAGDERTTIRHLLSHTSGYAGLGFRIGSFDRLKDAIVAAAAEEPTESFGTFAYSDFNYGALGHIIEVVSGVTTDKFIEERIIEPLGLEETYTAFSPDMPWAERVNSRYEWNHEAGGFERYWSNRDPQGWSFYPAAFGLWATAIDYAEFMNLWLNGGRHNGTRLLSEESVKEALAPHGLIDGSAVYGYGWFVETPDEANALPPAFGHGGYDGTLARAFPADDVMVIILTHSRKPGNLTSFENRLAMHGLLQYLGPGMVRADDAGVEEVALPPDERTPYLGSYRGRFPFPWMEEEVVVRVWEENDRLNYRFGAVAERMSIVHHLVPLGNDRFALGMYQGESLVAVNPHVRLRFVVEEGKAETLKSGGEYQFTAQRADPDQLRTDIEQLLAKREELSKKIPIDEIIFVVLETEGKATARSLHRTLLESRPDSVRFGESLLNTLGYRLLRQERLNDAIAVFEMNVDAHPEAANPYDSLADAYRAAQRLEDAKRNYKRAVELAEKQGHENLEAYREKLKQVTQQLEER